MDLQGERRHGDSGFGSVVGMEHHGMAQGGVGSLEASEHLHFHRDKKQRGHRGLVLQRSWWGVIGEEEREEWSFSWR